MILKILFSSLLACFVLSHSFCFSQEESSKPEKKKTRFQTGLYLGSNFANKHSASLYDGYGYDVDGNKNNFINSFMYRRIVLEYGSGQIDQVAIALGVNPGEWKFDQTDMPFSMKYNPSFAAGVNLGYAVSKKDALFLNANVARLNLSGNFTIVITTPPIGPQPPGYQNIKTFGITGTEQRTVLQLGYRRILGDDDIFNFFVEAGPLFNMTQYLGNRATINSLQIDLATYYSQSYYPTYRAKFLRGNSFGGFAGLGLNITASANWTAQILYSPSFEKINIGEDPKPKLQHAAGLRVIYTL